VHLYFSEKESQEIILSIYLVPPITEGIYSLLSFELVKFSPCSDLVESSFKLCVCNPAGLIWPEEQNSAPVPSFT